MSLRARTLICLSLLRECAFVYAVPGFVRPNHPSVPESVRSATRAIFRIVPRLDPPTEYLPSVFKVIELVPDEFLKMKFGQAKQDSRDKKNIAVNFDGFATAFLAVDEKTIVTTRHMWDRLFWDKWQLSLGQIPQKKEELDELVTRVVRTKILFELIDSSGNIIFSPDQGDQGTLSFILNYQYFQELLGKPLNANAATMQINNRGFDFVALKLSRSLPNIVPLVIQNEDVKSEEPLFAVGYPSNYDPNYSRPTSSDGKSLWVARGSKVSEDRGAKALGLHDVLDAGDAFKDRLSFVDSEAVAGLSGGPLLNGAGRVVSLVTAGIWEGGPKGNRPLSIVPAPKLFRVGMRQFPGLFERWAK